MQCLPVLGRRLHHTHNHRGPVCHRQTSVGAQWSSSVTSFHHQLPESHHNNNRVMDKWLDTTTIILVILLQTTNMHNCFTAIFHVKLSNLAVPLIQRSHYTTIFLYDQTPFLTATKGNSWLDLTFLHLRGKEFCPVHVGSPMPSVLWRCWLGGRKGIRPVKNE